MGAQLFNELTERLPTFRWWWILVGLAAALVLFLASAAAAFFDLYYWYESFKASLEDEMHMTGAWPALISALLALVFAFWIIPVLCFTFFALLVSRRPKHFILASMAWVAFVVTTPLLQAWFGANACFNRATGEPLKWYVKGVGGALTIYDNGGFNESGVEKQPVTPEICRIRDLQKAGILPDKITDDPRDITYFDPSTGDPIVWFARRQEKLALFDADGFDPTTGELLSPVTAEVAAEARARADAEEQTARAEAEAQKAAEEAEARRAAHLELVSEFGAANYTDGTVIIGARAGKKDDISVQATQHLTRVLNETLKKRGAIVDEFPPQVYAAGHFEDLIGGDVENLIEVGLADKMRAAVLATVDAGCDESKSVAGVMTCTVSAQVRILSSGGATASVHRLTETAAGGSDSQALTSAVLLLVERHPEILVGV